MFQSTLRQSIQRTSLFRFNLCFNNLTRNVIGFGSGQSQIETRRQRQRQQLFSKQTHINSHTQRRTTSRTQIEPILLKARAGAGRTVRLSLLKYSDETDPIRIGWVVRLANENGYLSWCRNSFLLTVVGVAAWVHEYVYFAKEVAIGMFLLAGINLCVGTGIFFYHNIVLYRIMHMSGPFLLLYIAIGLTNLSLWASAIALYTRWLTADMPKSANASEPKVC
ncbi:PREDICTED: uncharacterized protein LOC106814082 [Priapulus caudatus]|uniref:Uncharacterized protein LOC106814082 n=1 Tax=Priapulus caudatus TaxID=37621 RepID=A0ABM1ENS7_PRICU|nr:PREDICTED: uncharacterized protein LOC106814082 [Priapulus caudatus]